MLAELVDHVIGIDPDKEWITAAIVESKTTRLVESARFSANRDGYLEAAAWADEHTTPGERAWAIEGSGSFGRGLTSMLASGDEWVIEFDWARQKATKDASRGNAPSSRCVLRPSESHTSTTRSPVTTEP